MSALIPCAGESVNIDDRGCGCIIPEGSIVIKENGTHNVYSFEEAVVDIAERPPEYTGSITIIPSLSQQVLATSEKTLTQDITVEPIPNNYGLVTWDGNVLTIS